MKNISKEKSKTVIKLIIIKTSKAIFNYLVIIIVIIERRYLLFYYHQAPRHHNTYNIHTRLINYTRPDQPQLCTKAHESRVCSNKYRLFFSYKAPSLKQTHGCSRKKNPSCSLIRKSHARTIKKKDIRSWRDVGQRPTEGKCRSILPLLYEHLLYSPVILTLNRSCNIS